MENELNNSKHLGNWRDLLDDFVKHNYNDKTVDEQDKRSIVDFLSLIKSDDSVKSIPKFFFKKPMTYNDLNFSVKTEAKSRFLSMKSFEIPSKKRISFEIILLNNYFIRFKRLMARA
jgi:hypothetical protein